MSVSVPSNDHKTAAYIPSISLYFKHPTVIRQGDWGLEAMRNVLLIKQECGAGIKSAAQDLVNLWPMRLS